MAEFSPELIEAMKQQLLLATGRQFHPVGNEGSFATKAGHEASFKPDDDGYYTLYSNDNKIGRYRTDENYRFVKVELESVTAPALSGKALGAVAGNLLGAPAPEMVTGQISIELQTEAMRLLAENNITNVTIFKADAFKFNENHTLFFYAKDRDNNEFTVCLRENAYSRIFINEGNGEQYTSSISVVPRPFDYSKHVTGTLELNRSTENPDQQTQEKETKRGLTNLSQLDLLIIYTELEGKHKTAFQKDPYSIGNFTGYRCPANVLTCGFGSTGDDYKSVMSVDEAYDTMRNHADYQRASLRNQIGPRYFDRLEEHEKDALTSLGYNAGRIGDGLVKLVREYSEDRTLENRDEVTSKMAEYNKARASAGAPLKVLGGLTNRRNVEIAMFNNDAEAFEQHISKFMPAGSKATWQNVELVSNDEAAHDYSNVPPSSLKKTAATLLNVDEKSVKLDKNLNVYTDSSGHATASFVLTEIDGQDAIKFKKKLSPAFDVSKTIDKLTGESAKPTAKIEMDDKLRDSLREFEQRSTGADKPRDMNSLMASLPKVEISGHSKA